EFAPLGRRERLIVVTRCPVSIEIQRNLTVIDRRALGHAWSVVDVDVHLDGDLTWIVRDGRCRIDRIAGLEARRRPGRVLVCTGLDLCQLCRTRAAGPRASHYDCREHKNSIETISH